MSNPAVPAALQVYHIEVAGVAETPIHLPAGQPGMALRGAFFGSLWERFCTNHAARQCADCALHTACPVSALVAPLRDEQPRGRDVPRPYAIRALGATGTVPAGAPLHFGLTLFGGVLPYLPYVVLAAQTMGQIGVGARDSAGRRGRFRIRGITAVNLVTGARQAVLDSQGLARAPTLAAGSADVTLRAASLAGDTLTVEFLTPTRLVDDGRLVQRPAFRPLFQRLLERVTALDREYGNGPPTVSGFQPLLAQADQMRVVDDQTQWLDVASYSQRRGQSTPIGGLLGTVRFRGDFTPLLPWLVWGELTQVGKDVVKGNGCYRLGSTGS